MNKGCGYAPPNGQCPNAFVSNFVGASLSVLLMLNIVIVITLIFLILERNY